MIRRIVLTVLLVAALLQPCLAARRRGAPWFPNKETTVDMAGMNQVFIGWVDLGEDTYASHGYATKQQWAAIIEGLNSELLRLCQGKYLLGKTVTGAKAITDQAPAESDLYIKFSDVMIDYSKYHLQVSMHFINPKSGAEIASLPARAYFGNDWGFVNYLKSALDEIGQKIRIEVVGPEQKKKRKIPLIGKRSGN